MKIRKILLLFILSLFFPFYVYADCSDDEIAKFREVEDEYTIESSVDYDNKESVVILKGSDFNKFSYVIDDIINSCTECELKESSIICKCNLVGKHSIGIFSSNYSCIVDNLDFTVSGYNSYSEDELCDGLEDFYLCQKEIDEDIDYDTFVSRINLYKNSKISKTNDDSSEEDENELLDYIEDNKTNVIIISVFSILVIITIILTVRSYKDRSVLK